MMSNVQKQNRGFTLVETLVAITVLLLVIIGPITAAQKGIKNAYYASEQLTAVFLAQEAVEAVRELRDARALEVYKQGEGGLGSPTASTNDWDYSLPSNCDGDGCGFDVKNNSFDSCGTSNNNCKLSIGEDGQYSYDSGGVESPYTRKVSIGSESGGGWPVTATVTWDSQVHGTKIITIQTWVYDQYRRYEN